MPFNNEITQFTIKTKNHASVFNEVNNKLLENTKDNKKFIDYYLGDIGIEIGTGAWELGTISGSSGNPSSSQDCIRTADFVAVTGGQTYKASNDKGYEINVFTYREDKSFIARFVDGAASPTTFTLSSDVAFIKMRTSSGKKENDLTQKLTLMQGEGRVNIGSQTKFDFSNGYKFVEKLIDGNVTLPIISMQRDAGSASGNEFSILEIKAPEINPKESTLTLLRSNLPNGGAEFIDFTDMEYDSGRKCCLVVQKRGTNAKLAPFDISFNDGTGRVDKFRVHPDALKVEATAAGLFINEQKVATDASIETKSSTCLLHSGAKGWGSGTYTPKVVRTGKFAFVTGTIQCDTPIQEWQSIFSIPEGQGFDPAYDSFYLASTATGSLGFYFGTDGHAYASNEFGTTWGTGLININFTYQCA